MLVLTSTFPRWKGDVEPPFVHELARRLTDSFDVHVLAPHAPGSKRREILDGVHVHRFRYAPSVLERLAYQGGILANLKKSPALFGLVPFFLATQLLATVRLLISLRIRVIQAHWIFPQGLIALLSRTLTRRRVRILCTSHGGDLYGLKGAVFTRIIMTVAAGCDHLTVVSRSMRRDLLEMGCEPGKISVIPMGVDLQHRFVPSKEPPCAESLLFVGRLVEKKGLRYLLEAMPEIVEQSPRVHLAVVGDGPSRRELEKLSVDLDLRGRVKFLGALRNDDLPRVYQRAGIVIFPSVVSDDGDREGFGLVLVEAMGCGCVTVVSDLPAMRDIVNQGLNGIVVAQKDAKGISQAVRQLMQDPKLSGAMAREGRATVLNYFDWGIIRTRYADLLKGMATDG